MNVDKPFSAGAHDHGLCVEAALDEAAALCERRGVRLTALRRRVLELVWQGHQPTGAYAVLEALRKEYRGAAPPTVYRALDFLAAHGLIHRIESLNAFIGCVRPDPPHAGQFLICQACGTTAELHDEAIREAVGRSASRVGFQAIRETVEVAGLCPGCRDAAGAG